MLDIQCLLSEGKENCGEICLPDGGIISGVTGAPDKEIKQGWGRIVPGSANNH